MNRRDFFKTIGVALAAGVATKAGISLAPAWTASDEFLFMLKWRHIPRLDCFGISASKVRTRCEALLREGCDRQQAFVTAVMEQAEAMA